MSTGDSLTEVETLLGYRFRNPALLQEALTHSSYPCATSYQRLEFVGDAALGSLFTNHLYLAHPDLDPGALSLLRAANISTEKLARVAVRHNLYRYLRRNTSSLDEKVRQFTLAIKDECHGAPYGGSVKAPKVLADIVEAVAAAVYVDCGLDLKTLWLVFRGLLEPIVTEETFELQPVTTLYELCQKQGKQVDIKYWRNNKKTVASVFVDGTPVCSSSSESKEIAKLSAAKESLQILYESGEIGRKSMDIDVVEEEEGAKKRLNDMSNKNKWSKPFYRVDKEVGPAHGKAFICSVHVETANEIFVADGNPKPRVKDAENSAAFEMLKQLSFLHCNGNVSLKLKNGL